MMICSLGGGGGGTLAVWVQRGASCSIGGRGEGILVGKGTERREVSVVVCRELKGGNA